MTRYYVTTAKKAAYLTYRHGLNIALRMLPSGDDYNPDDDLWLLSYCFDDELDQLIEKFSEDYGEDFMPNRFYIHPDSVGLLVNLSEEEKGKLKRAGRWPKSEEA